MGLLACTLVTLLLGGVPHRTHTLDITIQDDAAVLYGSDRAVEETTGQIARLGATYLRVTASWWALAPAPNSTQMPGPPFDPGQPTTYSSLSFHGLDRALIDAQKAGLRPMVDVAFWAPRWAVPRAGPAGRNRYMPDPALFGQFAKAIALRYDGRHRYPANPRVLLPAVKLFTVWNEPNQSTFLEPQWRRSSNGWIPESPHIYRNMYRAAYAQIKAVDPSDQVLIGGTAANGSTTPGQGNVSPIQFLQSLTCVDNHLVPLRIPECAGYTPLKADGYAHHPYSMQTTPAARAADPNSVPLSEASRLETMLHLLALTGRFTSDLPLYETEYGYETDPPDPFARFTPMDQARFIGWSTYLAWRDPDTRMFAQFLLRDSAPGPGRAGSRRYWNGYQTGLYNADGTPKPAAEAFRLPFWAQRIALDPQMLLLFGQVRAPHSRAQWVRVEQLSNDGRRWGPIRTAKPSCASQGELVTDSAGYFQTAATADPGATLRLAWHKPDGSWEYGVPISVGAAPPLLGLGNEQQLGSVIRR